MQVNNRASAFILSVGIFSGLAALGYFLADAAIQFKQFDRSVTVKGLSEREVKADIVIWPIEFTVADNNLENLYQTIDVNTAKIKGFLEKNFRLYYHENTNWRETFAIKTSYTKAAAVGQKGRKLEIRQEM